MMIRVMYTDGRFDRVGPQALDILLKQKRVTCFMRSRTWAIVGRDSLRVTSSNSYQGKERRAS